MATDLKAWGGKVMVTYANGSKKILDRTGYYELSNSLFYWNSQVGPIEIPLAQLTIEGSPPANAAAALDALKTLFPEANSGSGSPGIFPEGTKIYLALLTQTGTNAPVATVLGTNTIGNIVWTRNTGGDYEGTLSGAFPANKTWLMISPSMADPASGAYTGFIFIRLDNNTLRLQTVFAPDQTDGQLFEQSILILVLP